MSGLLAQYNAWLANRWSPVVAIAATDEARALFHASTGLNVDDYFSTYREIRGLNAGLGGA